MTLVASLSFVAKKEDLVEIRHFVETLGKKFKLHADLTHQIRLAIDEAVANVLEHGYHNRPGWLGLTVRQDQADLIIQLVDEAPPFDPTQVPLPDLSIPVPLRAPGGMGLHLIRQALDEINYEASPTGRNRLVMTWRDVFGQPSV